MGDLGTCYHQCMADSDCRDGYACLKDIALSSGGAARYPNGACIPINCSASSPCPSGYQCVTVTNSSGQGQNVCAPAG